jgi:putative endonuclease
MYFVYVLQSEKDKNLYIGFTDNLKRRLEEHNQGKNLSTKSRIPLKLIFYEALPTLEEAVNKSKTLLRIDIQKIKKFMSMRSHLTYILRRG